MMNLSFSSHKFSVEQADFSKKGMIVKLVSPLGAILALREGKWPVQGSIQLKLH